MATPEAPDVTRLLLDWRQGQPAALERLPPLVYSELEKIKVSASTNRRQGAEDPLTWPTIE